MVKAFIDTVHSADIRIGFVAYNDRLLSTTSPISVGTNEERQVLRQLIDAHGYSGNTDIGLGLRECSRIDFTGNEPQKGNCFNFRWGVRFKRIPNRQRIGTIASGRGVCGTKMRGAGHTNLLHSFWKIRWEYCESGIALKTDPRTDVFR